MSSPAIGNSNKASVADWFEFYGPTRRRVMSLVCLPYAGGAADIGTAAPQHYIDGRLHRFGGLSDEEITVE